MTDVQRGFPPPERAMACPLLDPLCPLEPPAPPQPLEPLSKRRVVTGWAVLLAVVITTATLIVVVLWWVLLLIATVAKGVARILWGWRK